MSETTHSRRAALGALASIPVLALPAVAMAAGMDTGPDAELFALVDAERLLDAKVTEAERAAEEALQRTERPAVPDVLICRADDCLGRAKRGDQFGEADREIVRSISMMFGDMARKDLASKFAPCLIGRAPLLARGLFVGLLGGCFIWRQDAVVHADEARGWDALHAHYDMRRINHSEAYSRDGACTNQAESFFSRVRRAEFGIHHRMSGQYLSAYATEMAWREDHRRASNGAQFNAVERRSTASYASASNAYAICATC